MIKNNPCKECIVFAICHELCDEVLNSAVNNEAMTVLRRALKKIDDQERAGEIVVLPKWLKVRK